jgi:flagellar biosynthesis anti-sigma factor FlgM
MPDPIGSVAPAGPVEVPQAEQSRAAPTADTTSRSSSPVPVDSADVSCAEALLATISAAAAEVPAIDEARIAELQRAIQTDTYQVNARQIAEKIVEIERLLSPVAGSR